jgi:hypothetical protein
VDDDEGPDSLVEALDDGDLHLGTVEIVRYISAAGQDLVIYRSLDSSGADLPLIEALGMLRMTEDGIIRTACGTFPPPTDEA